MKFFLGIIFSLNQDFYNKRAFHTQISNKASQIAGALLGQTVYFKNCTLIYAKRTIPLFFFCSFILFDRSDKILTCLMISQESRSIKTQNYAPIHCTV